MLSFQWEGNQDSLRSRKSSILLSIVEILIFGIGLKLEFVGFAATCCRCLCVGNLLLLEQGYEEG